MGKYHDIPWCFENMETMGKYHDIPWCFENMETMGKYHDMPWCFENMETMGKYHGVLKQVNHGISYNYHTQYMKKTWSTTVYHVMSSYNI